MLNKLKLDDLKVQSFITELDEQQASQVAGGGRWETRVSACVSVEICENSLDTFCYRCDAP
jgi:hypothetical protein